MGNQDVKEVRGVIDKHVYNVLIHLVNISGVGQNKSQYLVGELIGRGIKDKLKELKLLDSNKEIDDPAMRLSVMCLQDKLSETRKHQLAYLASKCASDSEADKLVNLADELGIELDNTQDLSIDNPLATAIVYEESNPSTKVGRCKVWLANLFSGTTEMPRNQIMELAEIQGYNDGMVQSCKRKLGLGHKKVGAIWWWTSPSMDITPTTKQKVEAEDEPF